MYAIFKNKLFRKISPILESIYLLYTLMLNYKGRYFFYFLNFFLKKNHYVPVSQANWSNVTSFFTDDNLFLYHSCIGWSESSPHQDLNPRPQIERLLINWAIPPPKVITAWWHILDNYKCHIWKAELTRAPIDHLCKISFMQQFTG